MTDTFRISAGHSDFQPDNDRMTGDFAHHCIYISCNASIKRYNERYDLAKIKICKKKSASFSVKDFGPCVVGTKAVGLG